MVSFKACFLSGYCLKKIVPIIKNQAVNLRTIEIMKWQRVYCFLVVLLLILPAKIFSQQQMPRYAQKSPHTPGFSSFFQQKTTGRYQLLTGSEYYYFIDDPVIYRYVPSIFSNGNQRMIEIITPGFYTSALPFFCKKELQVEKTTYLPLRFRLGSLEYVNKMEGKERQ
jgi:hypothetical protein